MYEKEDVNRRRDRHDIIAEMLKAAMGGKIKTHLMYELKLNYPQVVDYLELLIEKKLLENNTIKQKKRVIRIYRTTERGMEFLDHLESVNKLWTH
ncbi:MAG: winged helix-turn-helix domain-containing protein [Candidatus Bathyarchaeota archaeon]